MQEGDFLKIEYVGRISLTGEIFDLTDEELAKKEGIYNKDQRYGPQLVIIGSGMAVPGVEKQLIGMKVGEEREFDVPMEEGFGKRNPGLIKILSYQRFINQKMNPVPGIFVNIDGRNAKIQSVSGGRVRVDFNSPLAGKDLHYRVRISERITGAGEKAQSLIDHYGMKARVTVKENAMTIQTDAKLPDQVKQVLNLQLSRWIKEAKKIDYVSTRDRKAASGKGGDKPSEKTAAKEPVSKAAPVQK
jgi:FKBP-type peptidyl-prolyl cis-trans isomerase 2